MNIVEHELKKYDMWNEELQKKKKADILFGVKTEIFLLQIVGYFGSSKNPAVDEITKLSNFLFHCLHTDV